MVCVPPFASTGQVALLDLETLDCTPLRFSSAVGGVDGDAKSAVAAVAEDKSAAASAMDVDATAAD